MRWVADPDMLEVGCKHGPGGSGDPGLTDEETRSHFGAWAIVSSPLTLSHDVNDKEVRPVRCVRYVRYLRHLRHLRSMLPRGIDCTRGTRCMRHTRWSTRSGT